MRIFSKRRKLRLCLMVKDALQATSCGCTGHRGVSCSQQGILPMSDRSRACTSANRAAAIEATCAFAGVRAKPQLYKYHREFTATSLSPTIKNHNHGNRVKEFVTTKPLLVRRASIVRLAGGRESGCACAASLSTFELDLPIGCSSETRRNFSGKGFGPREGQVVMAIPWPTRRRLWLIISIS